MDKASYNHRHAFAVGVAVAMSVWFAASDKCRAGIISPTPVNFDANDLERELASRSQSGGAAVPKSSEDDPFGEHDRSGRPSDHFKTAIPLGQTSSSGSSSSTGGPTGSGAMMCTLSNAIVPVDDALLGRIPEDHGLSLPDPPGTDLLRPPRA